MRTRPDVRPATFDQALENLAGTVTMGGFTWNIFADELNCSARLLQLLEVDRESYIERWQHFIDCIFPEDLLPFEEEVSQILAGRNEIEVQFRIATPSGIKPVILHGDVFRNEHGDAVQLEGYVRHVTSSGTANPSKVGQLVSETIHGVNNIFTSILGSTSMASSVVEGDKSEEKILAYLEEIENETLRAAVKLRKLAQSVKRSK